MVVGSFEEWLVGIADVYIEIDCRSRVANAAKIGQTEPRRSENGPKRMPQGHRKRQTIVPNRSEGSPKGPKGNPTGLWVTKWAKRGPNDVKMEQKSIPK